MLPYTSFLALGICFFIATATQAFATTHPSETTAYDQPLYRRSLYKSQKKVARTRKTLNRIKTENRAAKNSAQKYGTVYYHKKTSPGAASAPMNCAGSCVKY